MKSMTPEEREALIADIKAGVLAVQEIADKHGVHNVTVYKYRKELGLKKGKSMKGAKGKSSHLSQERILAMCEDIAAGMSNKDVMEKHGVGSTAVIRYKKRLAKGMIKMGKEAAVNGHANGHNGHNGLMNGSGTLNGTKLALRTTILTELDRNPEFFGRVLHLMANG